MSLQSISQSFSSAGSSVINAVKNLLPLHLGIPEGIKQGISSQYIVTILNESDAGGMKREPVQIDAMLQEKFVMETHSHWKSIGQMFGFGQNADTLGLVFQGLSGQAFNFSMSTRRIWQGTDPLSLRLKLRLEAFQDQVMEVTAPCARLQAMALPSESKAGGIFLTPPGPNPFYLRSVGIGPGEDKISIIIGSWLIFSPVIIKRVQVTYESRMGYNGPIGADVDIEFETYQMLTKNDLQTAYRGAVIVEGQEIKDEKTKAADIKRGGIIAGTVGVAGNLFTPNTIPSTIAAAKSATIGFNAGGITNAVPTQQIVSAIKNMIPKIGV